MKNIFKNEKGQFIALLLVLILISFLNSSGTGGEFIGYIVGSLLGSLGLGIIIGNIYFRFNKKERNNWQRWCVIVIVAIIFYLWRFLPSMWTSFSSGFQQGYQREIN